MKSQYTKRTNGEGAIPENARMHRNLRTGHAGRFALPGFVLVATWLSGWALLPGAWGQETDSGPSSALSNLSLEELMSIPVYAASRREQSVMEAPSSITIITQSDIKTYGWRTLSEILNSAPGMYESYDRTYRFAGVRGFLPPGDYNSRLLVLINGRRLNEGISGGAALGYANTLDVDLIKRVEIVRGPSSSLYGSGAFFGVVNIITRSGRDLEGAEVALAAGRYDTFTGRFSYGGQWGDAVEILLSGTYRNSDGQDFYFSEFDAPETNNGWARDRDNEEAPSLFLQVLSGDLAFELSYIERTKYNPTASWGTIFNDPDTRDRDTQLGVSLSYDHDFADVWNLYALLGYDKYEYEGVFPYDWAEEEGDPVDRVLNIDGAESDSLSGEVKIATEAVDRNTITGGIEYRRYFRQDQWNRDEGIEEWVLDSQRDSNVWGFYLQDELKLHEKLLLHAGLRYDYTDPLDQGKVSPRLGLIMKPAEKTVLKFLYGQAFRSPSAYELYYDDGNVWTKANPDLDPETIETFEVVAEQGVTDYLHASLSLYRNDIEDLVTQVLDPEDELLQFQNLENAEALGLEAALQGRLGDRVNGRISYSYVDARDSDTDERLINSPQDMVKLHIDVPRFMQRLTGGLELLYTGDRKTLAGATASGYAVVNGTLLVHDLPGGIELSASVYNLFDEGYDYPVAGEFEQDTLAADGRDFRIKATCNF